MNKLILRILRNHGGSKHNHGHEHHDHHDHDHHKHKQELFDSHKQGSRMASKVERVSEKEFFKFFQKGVELSLENKLDTANIQFEKCLTQIKKSKQDQLQHYSFVLRRIANNLRRMGKMRTAEEKLYDIIKHKRQIGIDASILYNDYDILYRHMITYDADKAIKLCRALLLKEKDEMPIAHTKLFQFNLGNAYLITGKYLEAKSRYSKCLQLDPQGKLKSYTYNNLGLACWWHKNPFEKIRQQLLNEDTERIQKDFKQTKQILAKSVQLSQLMNKEISETQKMILTDVLDFKSGKINQNVHFESPYSLHGLYNIAQYYLANEPQQKGQILFWLTKALQLAKKTQSQKVIDRISVEYSLLTNKISQLLEVLPQMIQKNRDTQNFADEAYFCHVLSRICQEKERKQAEQNRERYLQLSSVLPGYSFKLKNLAMDELNLYN